MMETGLLRHHTSIIDGVRRLTFSMPHTAISWYGDFEVVHETSGNWDLSRPVMVAMVRLNTH